MLTVLFQSPSKDDISTLSALEIAEQMTYLDQKIMFTINSNEFLEQAWIKSERKEKSPHIVVMTKRFNDVSNVFWEGHKNWKIFTVNFTICSNRQIDGEDFVNFCGLLRNMNLIKVKEYLRSYCRIYIPWDRWKAPSKIYSIGVEMAKFYPFGRTSKWNSEDGLNDTKESN